MPPELNRAIEAASLRAWPAVEEVRVEGWANSVQALAGSSAPISERVERCEAWYEDPGP